MEGGHTSHPLFESLIQLEQEITNKQSQNSMFWDFLRQHSVVDPQNTGSLSIEIPEHRVLENRNTAQFVSVGEGQMLQFFS